MSGSLTRECYCLIQVMAFIIIIDSISRDAPDSP